MKQTLFEAEAVLSVNTDKMFADLEKAAKDAKRRLESILGSVAAPTIGGGGGGSGGGRGGSGGGSGGGGAGGNPNRRQWNTFYTLEREYAKQEAAVGRLASAERILANLSKNSMITETQRQRAATARLAMEQKIADTREKIERKDQQFLNADGSWKTGKKSRINPVGVEMAEIRLLRNTQQYEQALIRIDQLLEEQLTRRQRIAVEALKSNVESSQEEWEANGGVNPGLRRRNAIVQNASFAFQDFATVLSMGGGMSRALASASNNLSFMTSMLATTGGAVAGLAITLGAVFLPSMLRAAAGMKNISDSADKAAKSVTRLRNALQAASEASRFSLSLTRLGDYGDLPGVRDKKTSIEDDIAAAEAGLKAAPIREARVRNEIADDFYTAMGGENSVAVDIKQLMQDVRTGKKGPADLDKMAANTNWADRAFSDLKDNLKEVAKRLRESQEPANDLRDSLILLNQNLAETDKVLKDMEAQAAAMKFGVFDDVKKRDDAAFNRRRLDEAFEKNGNFANPGLVQRLPALKEAQEAWFPKDAQIREIKEKFKNLTGGVMDPQMQAMMDYEISQVKNPSKGELSGQMGGAEFANQLTSMLSKTDPQTKLAEFAAKQVGLQERIAKATEAAEKRLDELENSPFSNN